MRSCAYQSPINLDKNNSFPAKILLELEGSNKGATFDPKTKNFYPNNDIILVQNGMPYILVEYHFHVPSEHSLNNQFADAEIHYVFEKGTTRPNKKSDDEEGALVIAHLINICRERQGDIIKKLEKFPILVPSNFFRYDGSLTTPDFDPVGWIVSDEILCLRIGDISAIAKPSDPLQPENDRIILYSKTCHCGKN